MTHPDDEYHHLIGRCEQVFINGYLLRQVLDPGQMAPGTFFADVTNQKLLVWDAANRDPNKLLIEGSVRGQLFRVEGDYVQLKGLHFRFAANPAQAGAVVLVGHHETIEDCVLESMNGSGATFSGEDTLVRRCVFRDNGQLGFGACRAHRLLMSDCWIENNNTKDFARGWEAGGDKLVLCRDAVVERSTFIRNRGTGIWFDIGNENCTVRQCLIKDNEDAGIFYEISYGLHASDDVIVGNGFAETPGAWGAQAGIVLSSSPGCLLERNLLVGNREGFNFREQTRTTPRIDGNGKEQPIWNHDEVIQRNIIAFNRDAQLWGWFDMRDGRHWPKAGAGGKPNVVAARQTGSADAYLANNNEGQPAGLTLEKLNLRFADNLYFAAPGQGWFAWGVKWSRHSSYSKLADFQTELGIDHASRVFDPGFAGEAELDFRVSTQIMAGLQQCYPRVAVPGVKLGTR